jgi:hypothetical protein
MCGERWGCESQGFVVIVTDFVVVTVGRRAVSKGNWQTCSEHGGCESYTVGMRVACMSCEGHGGGPRRRATPLVGWSCRATSWCNTVRRVVSMGGASHRDSSSS